MEEDAGPLHGSRPAWVNTTAVLVLLLGLWVTGLVMRDPTWSRIEPLLRQANMDVAAIAKFPWFAVLALGLSFLGLRRMVWNLTTHYEFWADRARIIHGGFLRQEREYPWSVFKGARFNQHPGQLFFRSGTLLLEPYSGETLCLEECQEAEIWARKIRPLILANKPQQDAGQGSQGRSLPPVSRAQTSQPWAERPQYDDTASRLPPPDPQQPVVVVKEKSSGCGSCLIVLLILILAPLVLGLIFKVAVITSIITALRDILK